MQRGSGGVRRGGVHFTVGLRCNFTEVLTPRKPFELPMREPVEPTYWKNDKGLCCGAGGAQMWMEEQNNNRVNVKRTLQLIDTGATTVASACPFCMTMLSAPRVTVQLAFSPLSSVFSTRTRLNMQKVVALGVIVVTVSPPVLLRMASKGPARNETAWAARETTARTMPLNAGTSLRDRICHPPRPRRAPAGSDGLRPASIRAACGIGLAVLVQSVHSEHSPSSSRQSLYCAAAQLRRRTRSDELPALHRPRAHRPGAKPQHSRQKTAPAGES
jgi:hypothetical protein